MQVPMVPGWAGFAGRSASGSRAALTIFPSAKPRSVRWLRGVSMRLLCCAAAMVCLAAVVAAQNVNTTVSTGSIPLGVAVNPATNKVYVTNSGTNTVTVFNAASGAATTVTVGSSPQDVAVNPATNRIYVTSGAGVSVIDGNTDSVVTTVAAGSNPTAIAVDIVTNQVYVANSGDNTATVIDGTTNNATTITGVGAGPNAIAINPVSNRVYITTSVGMAVIDGGSNSVFATPNVGTGPTAVAVNPVTNLVYVANGGSGDVTVIDGAMSNPPVDIAVGGVPNAVVADPVTNMIYVANQGGFVSVIDGTTNLFLTVTVGLQPSTLAVNPVTNEIYVPNNGDGTLSIVNGANDVATAVNLGGAPLAVAVNPVTGQVYVANSQASGGLTVLNGNVYASAAPTTGNNPGAVAANPVTNKMYIANGADGTVTVVNELTQNTATVTVGTTPQAVAINPVTNQVFVANAGSNTVTIINGVMDTVQTTVSTDTNPAAIAVNPLTDKVYVANNGGQDVTVIDGGTQIGQATLDGSGHATLQTSALDAGNHSITATYLGSASYFGSSSGAVQEVITAPPASISTVSGSGQSAAVNSEFAAPLVVLVLDSNLNPVPNAQVSFSGAGLSFSNSGLATTDSNGHASVTARAPQVSLTPNNLTFGSQIVGTTSAPQTVTVNNTGTSPLVISNIAATGNFSQTNNCSNVAPAGTCTIQVTFTPTVAGMQSGAVSFSGNVAIPPVVISGTGVQPSLQLVPSSLAFPVTTVTMTSAPHTIAISNTGTSVLTVVSIAPSAEFSASNTCSTPLASGNTCSVTVTFAPSASGLRSGTLTITSNTGAGPQIVPLAGTGADYSLTLSSGASSTATIVAGGSATFQAVASSVDYSNSVSLACLGAPPLGTCTLQPTSVQLNGGTSSPVTVTVTTAGKGAASLAAPHSWPLLVRILLLVAAAGMLLFPRPRPATQPRFAIAFLLLVLATFWPILGGCNGVSGSQPTAPATPSGTYNVILVGTGADGLQRSLQLTVTVN